jgi:hypothetical protein
MRPKTRRANGQRGYFLTDARRYVTPWKAYGTLVDRACRLLWPEIHYDGLSELLRGRVSREGVRAWHNGRRRPPVWVLSVLCEVTRAQARALGALAEECEREVGRRANEVRVPLARGVGGRWLPRGEG